MIVLRENEWAEEMIEKRSLGTKPSETLCRVARYYLSNGFNKTQTRAKLELFLLLCNPVASTVKWSDTIDMAMKQAIKYSPIEIESIPITENELETIQELDSRQAKRLAFTLLCLAKYWMIVNPNCDYWVCNKNKDIMRLANINTSLDRQAKTFATLEKAGLIQYSKRVDNTNVRVLFVDEDSDVKLEVYDFVDLGNQYHMYVGEPFFKCKMCGKIIKYNNPRNTGGQKYCKDCAAKKRLQQTVSGVMNDNKHKVDKDIMYSSYDEEIANKYMPVKVDVNDKRFG